MKTIIETINDLKAIANNTIKSNNINNSKGFVKTGFFRRDFYTPLIEQITSTLSKHTPTHQLVDLLEDWIIDISLKSDSNIMINEFWAEFKSDMTKLKNKIEESILSVSENDQSDNKASESLTIPVSNVYEKDEFRNLIKAVMKEELNRNKIDAVINTETKQPEKALTESLTIPASDMTNMNRDEFKSLIKEVMKEILDSNSLDSSIKPDSDDLIKIDDVAKMFKVSTVTIHKWKKDGLIPFQKLNRRLYFKKADVLNSMRKIGKIQ